MYVYSCFFGTSVHHTRRPTPAVAKHYQKPHHHKSHKPHTHKQNRPSSPPAAPASRAPRRSTRPAPCRRPSMPRASCKPTLSKGYQGWLLCQAVVVVGGGYSCFCGSGVIGLVGVWFDLCHHQHHHPSSFGVVWGLWTIIQTRVRATRARASILRGVGYYLLTYTCMGVGGVHTFFYYTETTKNKNDASRFATLG